MYSGSRGILYTPPPGPDGVDDAEPATEESTAADAETRETPVPLADD